MYSYTLDGAIVRLVVTGTSTLEHRESVLSAIRRDPGVPNGALLLIDASRAESVGSAAGLQERAHLLVQLLGSKMGSFCAVIVPPALAGEAALFQAASGELGVRVALFDDAETALEWLRSF